MNTKTLVLLVLVVSAFLAGCTSSNNGYQAYNQPPPQGQQAAVGGGCGVAPGGAYEDTPVSLLTDSDSGL